MHGGAAPQVRKAARERIADMVDPALAVLRKSMKSKVERICLDAAKDVLDRAGYKATDKLVLSGSGPLGEIVHTTAADLLKAELDSLHERIAPKS